MFITSLTAFLLLTGNGTIWIRLETWKNVRLWLHHYSPRRERCHTFIFNIIKGYNKLQKNTKHLHKSSSFRIVMDFSVLLVLEHEYSIPPCLSKMVYLIQNTIRKFHPKSKYFGCNPFCCLMNLWSYIITGPGPTCLSYIEGIATFKL